jgi:hypothetical protein
METYRQRLPELLAHEGRYVIIHGDEVAGFRESLEDAERFGYERYGFRTPFLVKRVRAQEPVYRTNRNILPCPSSTDR